MIQYYYLIYKLFSYFASFLSNILYNPLPTPFLFQGPIHSIHLINCWFCKDSFSNIFKRNLTGYDIFQPKLESELAIHFLPHLDKFSWLFKNIIPCLKWCTKLQENEVKFYTNKVNVPNEWSGQVVRLVIQVICPASPTVRLPAWLRSHPCAWHPGEALGTCPVPKYY